MVLDLLIVGAAVIGASYINEAREKRKRERRQPATTAVSPPVVPRYLQSSSSASSLSSSGALSSDNPTTLAALYERMKVGPRQIRILVLKPAGFNEGLECSLELGSVDNSTYEALSYAWRAPPNTHPLKVNGIDIKIRENLFNALRHLRFSSNGAPRRLWVDAICINQEEFNNPEKDEQLSLMGDVYGNAKEVLAWLGLPSEITVTYSALKHFQGLDNSNNLSLRGLLADYEQNREKWLDFGDGILSRDWFTRVWTVQEFVQARRLRFQCGTDSLSLRLVSAIALLGSTRGIKLQRPRGPGSDRDLAIPDDMTMLITTQDQWRSKEDMDSIVQWILQFSHRQCENPHDHIYGYLSLDKTCPIKPCYSESWQKVYVNATEYILRRHGSLDVLGVGQGDYRDAMLPSWVPDLRVSKYGLQPTLPRINAVASTYRASGSLRAQIDVRGTVLEVTGHKFKQINLVTCPHDDDEHHVEHSRQLAFDGSGSRRHLPYPCCHNHTYEEAFRRTMVMDLDPESERIGDAQCMGFREWDESFAVPTDSFPTLSPLERWQAFRQKKHRQERIWRLGRRFAMLRDGYMALVPPGTRSGDLVVVFQGASMPMVIRDHPSWAGCHMVVGLCYVHGIMDGELFRSTRGSPTPWKLR